MYKPIEYAYQVGRNVFAGEHPLFDIYKRSAKGNIPALLRFGITVFLDLTQSYEVPEYASFYLEFSDKIHNFILLLSY